VIGDADPAPEVHRVVDAHHHLWDLSAVRHPWLQGPREDPADPAGVGMLQRDYTVADLLADADGVPLVASVHVEAAAHPADAVRETAWLQSLADEHGFPHAIVPHVDLAADDVEDVLAAHLEHSNVRGVRQMLDRDPATGASTETALMEDPRWLRGLALLAPLGLSFDLQVLPSQLPVAARVAAAHDELVLVLNHGGYHVPASPTARQQWTSGVRLLAEQPNVVVKASGYDTVDPGWPQKGVDDFLAVLLDAFGVDRVLFASNFPVDGRTITYPRLVGTTARALRRLDDDERDRVFCRNAIRTYRLASVTEPVEENDV
jgi:predicted TIM-barrel fold metal-dependent hydrolase